MLRFIVLSFFIIFPFSLGAVEISCVEPIGQETAFFMNGELSIEKNDEYGKVVYSISDKGNIEVTESTSGREEEQKLVDKLSWTKFGNGYLGNGPIDFEGNLGTGSVYIDEKTQIITFILYVDGQVVSANGSFPCTKVN